MNFREKSLLIFLASFFDFAKRKGHFAKSFENDDLLRKVIGALIVLFWWENELQSDIITLTHL